ncbi:MAG TPA: LytTR family DNA-binding domain-containing protein [Lacunisphaera sp.]|nr:LytTR family DNA-binding domain-containing protein [Lacunisphaera sp.]
MSPLRALIIDDDALARERLGAFLCAEPAIRIAGECESGTEAMAAIRSLAPELVFLDMQLPGCDGLNVLQSLPGANRPAVIVVTAHAHYAVPAFETGVVDFLLKPFDLPRLQVAVRRARDAIQSRRSSRPAAAEVKPADRECFTVKADGRIVFLQRAEIVRIESAGSGAIVHLATSSLAVRESMVALESRLSRVGFAWISPSILVNLDQIKEIKRTFPGEHLVLLRDGTRLALSRDVRGELGRISRGEA